MREPEMNDRMSGLLRRLADAPKAELDPRLASLLEDGLFTEGDLFLLSRFRQDWRQGLGNLLDKTGVECFVNHLHLADYVSGPAEHQLRQAVLFATSLASLLESTYPQATFRLIVSQNPQGTIARFHKVRPGEAFLGTDLEKYEEEAIWTCLTSPRHPAR